MLNLKSIQDAKIWYENSGYYTWDWFDGFRPTDFIVFIYTMSDGIKTEKEVVTEFLKYNGEDPSMYFKTI